MHHVVIDLETLSTREDAVILQLSAGIYDTADKDKNLFESIDYVNYKLQAKAQTEVGRLIDHDTLDWWKKQEESVKISSLYPNSNDVHHVEALDDFALWLKTHGFDKRNDFIWQRGDKDAAWLSSLFRTAGWIDFKAMPFNWWKVRDLRTAVDVLGASSKLNGYPDNREELEKLVPGYRHHDAASDVRFEFALLREIGIL